MQHLSMKTDASAVMLEHTHAMLSPTYIMTGQASKRLFSSDRKKTIIVRLHSTCNISVDIFLYCC